jgi:hypothetical protein
MSFGSVKGPTTNTNSTNNSTQQITLPPWVTEAQRKLLSDAGLMTGGFTGQAPQFGVAGLMPDQLLAGDLARQTAGNVFTTPRISAYDVGGMGGFTPATSTYTPATAQQADAAQLSPTAFQPFMNPYLDAVLDPTMDRLRQQQGEVQAKIGADAAAARSFGGSREAVARSLADRDYRNTAAQTVGSTMANAYNTASGLASQNTDRSQQANLTNAQLGTQASIANAGNTAGMTNALNQLGFQGSQNEADRFLKAVGLESSVQGQELDRQKQLIELLNMFGMQERGVAQQSLDYPYKMLQLMAGIVPNDLEKTVNTTGTSSGTTESSAPIDGLGAALSLGKMFFSDREAKTDIEEVGIDPGTGLMMYAYRYKSDPKTYPKVVGPMAQDVEAAFPGSTTSIGGKLVIAL